MWGTRRSCSGAAPQECGGGAAAFLGRLGQALFSAAETLIQVCVDDLCTVWKGTLAARSWINVILLLWWLVVGPAISWKKLQTGRQKKWIGVLVQFEEKAVVITLPDSSRRCWTRSSRDCGQQISKWQAQETRGQGRVGSQCGTFPSRR